MEDEVERLGPLCQTEFRGGHPLTLGQYVRLEHHIARLVNTVHIPECGSQ